VVVVEPAIPPGRERAYLEAAFDPASGLVSGDDTEVAEDEWTVLAGMEARRLVVEHTVRDERLVSEVLVAAAGRTALLFQCQAPDPSEVADGCRLVRDTLALDGSTTSGPG
jgi:hypothetical protein